MKKCCVCSVSSNDELFFTEIYRKYIICSSCQIKWHKAFEVLSKGKYYHVHGLEEWCKIFNQWRKELVKEKVLFT